MDRLINAMRLHMSGVAMGGAETRLGTVQSYDPVNGAARVLIQPEGVLTGWLPVGTIAAGAASIVAPPSIGDQVVLTPQEGDAEQWIVTGRLFHSANLPGTSPSTSAAIQSGELAIFGQSGACLHLHADGTWWLAGDLHVNGNIVATGGVTAGAGGGDQVALQSHRHGTGTAASGTVAPTAGT